MVVGFSSISSSTAKHLSAINSQFSEVDCLQRFPLQQQLPLHNLTPMTFLQRECHQLRDRTCAL